MKKVLGIAMIAVLCFAQVACSVDQALTDINLLIQAASTIGSAVGAVSPADSAIIAVVASIATQGLNAVQAAYDTYKKSGATTDLQKFQAAVAAVQANLAQELAAAHISDPAAKARVTAWVGLTSTTLTAVLELLPQLQSAQTASAKRAVLNQAAANKALTPETIKARWDSEVCGGEKKCAGKVKVHYHNTFTRYATFGIAK